MCGCRICGGRLQLSGSGCLRCQCSQGGGPQNCALALHQAAAGKGQQAMSQPAQAAVSGAHALAQPDSPLQSAECAQFCLCEQTGCRVMLVCVPAQRDHQALLEALRLHISTQICKRELCLLLACSCEVGNCGGRRGHCAQFEPFQPAVRRSLWVERLGGSLMSLPQALMLLALHMQGGACCEAPPSLSRGMDRGTAASTPAAAGWWPAAPGHHSAAHTQPGNAHCQLEQLCQVGNTRTAWGQPHCLSLMHCRACCI